jgi:hypothetical protein
VGHSGRRFASEKIASMPTVEVASDQLHFPPRCCRCGGSEYANREHTDDVVISTILSVTKYRKITLQIPVCDRCAHAQWIWFGAAIGLGGLGMLIASVFGESDAAINFVILLFVTGVIAAMVGVRKKPIKILKYDEDKDTLKIRIYNDEVARAVSRPPAAKRPVTASR